MDIPIYRLAAEGGENSHAGDNKYYREHTTRGNGKERTDPIYLMLLHTFKNLKYEINQVRDTQLDPEDTPFQRLVGRCNVGNADSPPPRCPDITVRDKLFIGMKFLLLGPVPKVKCRKHQKQEDVTAIIVSNGGLVVKSLPALWTGVKYLILTSGAFLRKKT